VKRLLSGAPAPSPAAGGGGAPLRLIRYGLSDAADVTAINIEFNERGSTFEVPGIGHFALFVPGEHNVRNALAAIAVARELKISADVTARALARFLGVDRRFQILGRFGGAIIVDDYAHHPTEIRATLKAARGGYPNRRIVALFQPHLYTRTRDFASEFAESLRIADVAMVAPIYAAREEPIGGITAQLIAIHGVEFIDRPNDRIVDEMKQRLQSNDIFITMGAGDIYEVAAALAREGSR
ncbi:MAG TPA: cyanophycin synthetase, partial [Thermoanaerobaculia bacterium]|nr:cyanophycin synthetase [Thermoanaerobaculia bacterium]